MRDYKLSMFNAYKKKVENAIKVIKNYEPKEGYYFGNSGGKDSEVLRHLLIISDVKFEAVHNTTGLGTPEQIRHIKKNHPETKFSFPNTNFRNLVIKNVYPPTRLARYCCAELKERGGYGRTKTLGIRQLESNSRAKNRKQIEVCFEKQTKTINPLYHWDENDIWRYISENNLKYCELYDKGYDRVGCMFCPYKPNRIRRQESIDYPKQFEYLLQTFELMLKEREKRGLETTWKNGKEVFEWWLSK